MNKYLPKLGSILSTITFCIYQVPAYSPFKVVSHLECVVTAHLGNYLTGKAIARMGVTCLGAVFNDYFSVRCGDENIVKMF